MKSRLSMALKNVFWSYFSMFTSILIKFVSRTVFIYFLGRDYLGINGLFTSVLGVLSFAELGIGTAINFSLYKPVAQGDIEKIKSYMQYYKKAYRIIAAIIAVAGLALIPFLKYIIKDPGSVGNITVYYLLFLFETVSSYFVSYKFSLVNADQKNYIFTNINLIISVVTTLTQIITLFIWKSYAIYLLIATAISLVQKIFVNSYLNRLYPYLKDKNAQKLTADEKNTLIVKIKSLIMHKIGDVCVHQTDNIIISAFMSVGVVGLISNYNLLITTVKNCISVLFNSITGSLGNLVATESPQKQYYIFRIYRFVGFWFYGFTSVALYILLSPFICLWLGADMTVEPIVVALIMLDYYMIGHRICLNNMKTVGGVFEQDKYVALIQAVVNLVASIAFVKLIGLPGVYVGTVLQGAISSIIKPIVSYRYMFNISSKYYFIDSVKYGFAVAVALVLCDFVKHIVMPEVTVARFVVVVLTTAIIPNVIFFILFHKSDEFRYVFSRAKQVVARKKI